MIYISFFLISRLILVNWRGPWLKTRIQDKEHWNLFIQYFVY